MEAYSTARGWVQGFPWKDSLASIFEYVKHVISCLDYWFVYCQKFENEKSLVNLLWGCDQSGDRVSYNKRCFWMFGIQIPITVYHIKRTFEYDNINLSSVERAVVIVGVYSSQFNFVTYEQQNCVLGQSS